MHLLDGPTVWSAVISVDAGTNLPSRRHSGLCEILVVHGSGHYASGQEFSEGDYLRETAGDYEPIKADKRLELFVTHHGNCIFLGSDGSDAFSIGPKAIIEQYPPLAG